ncbi:hypothetical protein AB0B12_32080 [Streptomyces sp. NPDC044780]|uniref:hypothetical protein n=1 Tax=unclassified Streptomyces TaxID=2593676 RepID=UPI0033D4CDE1
MISGTQLSSVRLLLPVKAFAEAKSRLNLPAHQRSLIARRLFLHTLDVALQCVRRQQVFVMTDDAEATSAAHRRRVRTLADAGVDLNTSLRSAVATLRHRFPDDTVVVIVTDLPRLAPPALTTTLVDAASSNHPRHVIDQHGVGTTLISIPPRFQLPMLFGPDSARRFTDAGSMPMLLPPPAIAHDLDRLSDLNALTPHQKENLCRNTPSPSSAVPGPRARAWVTASPATATTSCSAPAPPTRPRRSPGR